MANLMAFGTRNRVGMIPCPIAPFAHTVTRARSDFAMSNGATLVRNARMARQTFEFSWMDTLANLLPVIEMAKENSGPPYYFLDPGVLANGWNALPAHWSAPGRFMGADNALSIDFSGQFALMNRNDGRMADGLVTTPGAYVTAIGCPSVGVSLSFPVASPPYAIKDQSSGGVQTYLMDSGTLKASHVAATVLVPPGYKFAMRITADATSQAGVCYSRRTAGLDGRFSSIWATTITRLTVGGVTTPASFTNTSSQWSTVDIWFGGNTTATTGGTLSLYALEAYVLPAAGVLPAAFSMGVGSMPLWPTQDDMQIQTYGVAFADQRKQHGITWPMVEGDIAW
jgi:hypothetical protein